MTVISYPVWMIVWIVNTIHESGNEDREMGYRKKNTRTKTVVVVASSFFRSSTILYNGFAWFLWCVTWSTARGMRRAVGTRNLETAILCFSLFFFQLAIEIGSSKRKESI